MEARRCFRSEGARKPRLVPPKRGRHKRGGTPPEARKLRRRFAGIAAMRRAAIKGGSPRPWRRRPSVRNAAEAPALPSAGSGLKLSQAELEAKPSRAEGLTVPRRVTAVKPDKLCSRSRKQRLNPSAEGLTVPRSRTKRARSAGALETDHV